MINVKDLIHANPRAEVEHVETRGKNLVFHVSWPTWDNRDDEQKGRSYVKIVANSQYLTA